jgi:hypothetical protein
MLDLEDQEKGAKRKRSRSRLHNHHREDKLKKCDASYLLRGCTTRKIDDPLSMRFNFAEWYQVLYIPR